MLVVFAQDMHVEVHVKSTSKLGAGIKARKDFPRKGSENERKHKQTFLNLNRLTENETDSFYSLF